MSDIGHDDPLPSVDELLVATDWAGQLAAARERRAAALAGREPRPGLPETKPWESPDYLAVMAPASHAAMALPGPRLTGTPVLAPVPRRRRPVIAMAVAGVMVGGLLSPGIAERTALWLATPGEREADVAVAPPVPRAAAGPEAADARGREAVALAVHGEPAAFAETGAAQVTFPDTPLSDTALATLADAGGPLARPPLVAALSEVPAGAASPRAPSSAAAVDGRAAASPETGVAPAAISLPPSADGAAVAAADMRAPFVPHGPAVTLPETAAGAEVPRGDAPPVRPEVFAAVGAPRAGLPDQGISAVPRVVPTPRRAEVVGGMPPAAPGDALPVIAGEARPRIVVFLPDGEDAAAASGVLASLGEAGFTADAPGRVGFRVARTHVRHYHAADAARASAVAAAVGGEARDFTGFRPLPPPGTIEVWLAGAPRRAPVAMARAQEADRPAPARGPRFILAIHPDGSRERLRVIEDGGGAVTRAGRALGVWGGDAGHPAGRGGGSAAVAPDGGEAERGGPSGGGAPSPGVDASPHVGRDPGTPARGDGGGGRNGGGRGGGNGQGGENGRGNGNGGGSGGSNGHGNGHGNGKGNGGGNGKGGRG